MTLKVMLRWRLRIYMNFTSVLAAWWCYHHAIPLWVLHIQHPTISYLYGCESTSHTDVSGWQNPHPESLLHGSSDSNSTAINYYGSVSRRRTLIREETTVSVKRHCFINVYRRLCLQTFILVTKRHLWKYVTYWLIDNPGHLLTWTFIMVTLIMNIHLWS